MLEFKFPDVGEGITEGEIVKWKVKEGDTVKEHDIIVNIETDKAIVEIPVPKGGKILKIFHKEGETVKVGEVLVTIGEKGEGYKETKPVKKEVKRDTGSVVGVIKEEEEKGILATPSTRKIAKELNVDLANIHGTGPGGRITDEDVVNSTKKNLVKKKYDLYGYVDRIQFKGVRRSISKNLLESASKTVRVTATEDADATKLFELREKEKAKFKDVHLTFLPYIIKAVVAALKIHPTLNSSLNEEEGEIIAKKYYNFGVAVDTEDGLIVPVLKGVDQKSIVQLAKEMEVLAEKTRGRKIDLADLKGGTFTITNVGTYGGIYSTPIINYPEAAILATGKITDKPCVVGGKIVVRKVLPLSLTFDHRIVDGAEVAKFMTTLKDKIEKLGFL
ncbi:2-oxo acid dehydrogenase subunit E2 [Candidatus Woesearchaeota archaeon]|nr:2-oxo acid dehydrogenase subunit E2 [Candidatus Woesearchaeota archaeon]